MNRETKARLLATTLVVVCIALYFGWFINRALLDLGTRSFTSHFDFQSYFRPRFWLGSQELLSGRLPLWNEYEWGGLPLLATGQPAALYPPKALLFAVFDPVTAHWIFLVFHYVLLSGGLLLFFYDQGLGAVGAFAGAVAGMSSTLVLGSNYHPVRIACFAWMPFQFLLADRFGREASRSSLAWLALVVMLQELAGYPEFSLNIGLLIAVHAVVSYATGRWKRSPFRTVPWIAGAFLLGAACAGAQLLPLVELARVARRVSLADRVDDPWKWLKPFSVALIAAPGLMAWPIVGFWQRRARSPLALNIVCSILAGGGWRYLRYLPGFSMVRFPYSWMLLDIFPFAWVVAVGCDSISDSTKLDKWVRQLFLALLAASGLALSGVWLYQSHRAKHGGSAFFDVNIGSPQALVLGVVGGAALAVMAARSLANRKVPTLAWFIPPMLLALSHIAAVPLANQPAPFAPPSPRGLVATLHGQPRQIHGRTFCIRDIMYGYEMTDRLPSPLGIELSFLPYRDYRILERLRFIPAIGALDWGRFMTAHGFLDAMNVEFVAGPVELIPFLRANGIPPITRRKSDVLFRNLHPMGQAWVNYAVRRINDPESMLAHLLGHRFDPHREVLLERALKRSYPPPGPDTPLATPVDGVLRRSPSDVEYTVNLPRPGVFVASESSYPDWTATVDGASAEWFTADYILRGVELSAGFHVVRYRYEPASVRWGLAVSALGLTALVGLLVRARRA